VPLPPAVAKLALQVSITSSDPANLRDFPVDSTQQIQIKIAVPADAPAASYTLKLTLADEVNPDDNFTESPDVVFSVHDAPKPAPTPIPSWIIPAVLIGVAVIVIAIIAGVALSHRQTGGACQIKLKASQFVYQQPDTVSNSMLDQLQSGAQVVPIGKSADNAWYEFSIYNTNAWIQTSLLSSTADVSGDCNALPVVCLLAITSDQYTYAKPILDPNYQTERATAGYQYAPVGKLPDGTWWQLNTQKGWIPSSAIGTTATQSGDCSKLPSVSG